MHIKLSIIHLNQVFGGKNTFKSVSGRVFEIWHLKIREKAVKWLLSYFLIVFSHWVNFTYLSYYSYLLTK